MKSSLFYILFLLPLMVIGQNTEGKIIYDETVKMDIDIPEEHREQLKAVLPDSRTTKKVLFFNSSESIYKDHEGEDKEEVVEAGSEDSGFRMKMVIARPDNQLYKNFEKDQVFEKQELFGKDFLIVDESTTYQWKLANDYKEIAGYTCQKAIFEEEENKVEAWFTMQIPVSNGPMNYGKLPGMILELNVNEGQTHIVASEIELIELHKDDIQSPKKGKKVSREEYEKIVEEKQKEMEEEYGNSGGRMIIKHRRN